MSNTVSSDTGKSLLPILSAARSISGKRFWLVSWCARISRCANCRPVVPVWLSSSGMASCSKLSENRNPGSSGMPPTGASGAVSIAVSSSDSSRNQ